MDFDFFEVGSILGPCELEIAPLVAQWEALFPLTVADAHAPSGLLVAVMMRGYLSLLDRRPAGNVHAGQRLVWRAPADRRAPVTVTVRCVGKERRGDRPWLTFAAQVSGSTGVIHLDGEMRSLWAA